VLIIHPKKKVKWVFPQKHTRSPRWTSYRPLKGSGKAGAILSGPRSGSVLVGLLMPACTPKEQVRNQRRTSTRNVGADLSKHFFSCLDNKSSARQPPFGVQAGIRKDKPDKDGAASRTKGGCRARCADIPGASVSSPVWAEHVLSFTKPLQQLGCRGLKLWSVPYRRVSSGEEVYKNDAPLGRRRKDYYKSSRASSIVNPVGVLLFSS
jgi:hypothetical protein